MAVGERRERWDLRDEADDLSLARGCIVDVLRVGVERGEGRDGTDERAHGVGIVAVAVHELLDVLVQDRVVRDLVPT